MAFRQDEFDVLLAAREGPCVSLYLPTHRTGRDQQQDPIRFKNLLRRADDELKGIALRDTDRDTLLKPARALVGEAPFWEHASDGLAVFLAPGFFETHRLPAPFKERLVVSDSFHLKPLLPFLTGDGFFYVLALSQKSVRLLEASRYSIGELTPAGMPRSLADALTTVEHPEENGRSMRYPGHGTASAVEKADLETFFRRVDEELTGFLGERRAPLVLAGVERYFPLYREVSRYPHLVASGVKGNFDDASAKDLHARAWAVVEPVFLREVEEAVARYREGAGGAPTSAELETVVRAAHHGRVDRLFVARGAQRWGAWIPDGEGSVIRHATYEKGDQDLLDLAAAETLRHKGRVYALAPDGMPEKEAPAAAILRY